MDVTVKDLRPAEKWVLGEAINLGLSTDEPSHLFNFLLLYFYLNQSQFFLALAFSARLASRTHLVRPVALRHVHVDVDPKRRWKTIEIDILAARRDGENADIVLTTHARREHQTNLIYSLVFTCYGIILSLACTRQRPGRFRRITHTKLIFGPLIENSVVLGTAKLRELFCFRVCFTNKPIPKTVYSEVKTGKK